MQSKWKLSVARLTRATPFRCRFVWLLVFATGIVPTASGSQVGVPALSAEARISVLTILPGDEIYSMFGHTAFRVTDPALGIDQTYNYGTFAFGNPLLFAARFAYGDLEYLLSDTDFPRMVQFYRDVAKRPIIEQELNLSPDDRQRLFAFLEWNALPENRAYRYDFLFDNCSTRVRDAIDEQVPAARFDPSPAGPSFRRMLDPYATDRRFLDFGWDLLLGESVDRPATSWERMFLPIDLMSALESATLELEGGIVPLVSRTDTLFWIEGRVDPEPSAPWPDVLMWALFLIGLAITFVQRRGRAAIVARIMDGLLFLLVGVAGLMMSFMWLISLHHVTNENWNLLWAWPTHVLVALPLIRRSCTRILKGYLVATTVVAGIVLLGWPIWPQQLPSATIPLILLIALRSAWRAFGTGERQVQTAHV